MVHETALPSPQPQQIEDLAPEILARVESQYGTMSLRPAAEELRMYSPRNFAETAEIIGFKLEDGPDALEHGKELLDGIKREARKRGIQKILVTGGRESNTTAIGLLIGESPTATIDDRFGPHFDDQLWEIPITPLKLAESDD